MQAGYFLTGETRERPGHRQAAARDSTCGRASGAGGVELTARYNYLERRPAGVHAGFADPNLWTNRLYTTDIGFNWYLTQYLKFYFDWQHADFSNPVLFAPGRRMTTSDMFWLRFQLYF